MSRRAKLAKEPRKQSPAERNETILEAVRVPEYPGFGIGRTYRLCHCCREAKLDVHYDMLRFMKSVRHEFVWRSVLSRRYILFWSGHDVNGGVPFLEWLKTYQQSFEFCRTCFMDLMRDVETRLFFLLEDQVSTLDGIKAKGSDKAAWHARKLIRTKIQAINAVNDDVLALLRLLERETRE